MKVLVVEDDRDSRELFEAFVVEAGHEVVASAASVEAAVAAAALHCPDVAILDIGLHGPMIGIEGAHLLRQQCATIQIIFVTGFSEPLVIESTLSLTPVAYLVKPVSSAQVVAALILAQTSLPKIGVSK